MSQYQSLIAYIENEKNTAENFIKENNADVTDSTFLENYGTFLSFENVFCHNDLLSGNILIHKTQEHPGDIIDYKVETKNVSIIDYEYAGYNSRAWDLANHFNGNFYLNILSYK